MRANVNCKTSCMALVFRKKLATAGGAAAAEAATAKAAAVRRTHRFIAFAFRDSSISVRSLEDYLLFRIDGLMARGLVFSRVSQFASRVQHFGGGRGPTLF